MESTFQTPLTVDKNIVGLLSRSTYQRNFSYALREMISNAYDADATTVEINYDKQKNELIVRDNGNGMTRNEFEFYLRIAGQKRGKRSTPKFARKRIGRFGVGFLSILPFCETLEVVTTTENSPVILTASIPAEDFFRTSSSEEDVSEILVDGVLNEDVRRSPEHSTTLRLKNLNDYAQARLSKNDKGIKEDSIIKWAPYDRLVWELQDELPLPFPEGSKLNEVLAYPEPLGIEVYFQEKQLFRNDPGGEILESGEIKIEKIKCRFAIVTPWKPVKPIEMRFMKLRLNNVGVGPRRDFDIQRGRRYSRITWLSGEAHIIEGLDDAINLSREDFINIPEFEALSERLASVIRKHADEVEFIDVAARDMTKQVSGSKQVRVASKREVVQKNIQKLVAKGFHVKTIQATQSSKAEPVKIDRAKREILMVEGHSGLEDKISIRGKTYKIDYKDLDDTPVTKGLPCVLKAQNRVVVNTNYRLFQSKRYGELFKRFCILMAIAKESSRSADEMYEYLLKQFDEQFSDF
jgi:hypothetical protein